MDTRLWTVYLYFLGIFPTSHSPLPTPHSPFLGTILGFLPSTNKHEQKLFIVGLQQIARVGAENLLITINGK